ncbi:MAG TPA: 6,7-dimethyl-8-ribityllumazine synthase [Gaiellaceae bacterium]|nr:6,7-dimethyl-8-ribityllumazine synthase [Gaiellaceae bacterium]
MDETAVEDVVRPSVSEDTEDFDDPELDEDDDADEDDDDGDVELDDDDVVEDAASAEAAPEPDEPAQPKLRLAGHAPGDLDIPDGIAVLEGAPLGSRRGVGIVAARFNGEVTNSLLETALAELERAGVGRELITVMPVPGAFELPLGAMALAKTRRYACIVALGCVIRGETAHFDYVAGEAASGLQLAALETGVPVAFGVLTVDTLEQAMARADKGAEAVRTALEMADLFAQLRASAKSA